MSSSETGLMSLLTQRMSYLTQKEAVHAQNVSNANTPGYKARDIAPFNFNDALKQANVGMEVTDPRHIVPASLQGVNASTVKIKNYDVTPNGNDVDSEQETMKVSQTNIQYQLVTTLYHKFTGLLRLAIKGSTT